MNEELERKLKLAKKASMEMLTLPKENKNKALVSISKALCEAIPRILEENQKDIIKAKEKGIEKSKIDRLMLNEERIRQMAKDILKVRELEDPIGKCVREIQRPNGLLIQEVSVPLGVIAVIYEARPNVSVDVASLCIKSGNVCVLKGGSLALCSNRILTQIMNEAIEGILPSGTITFIDQEDRNIVTELLHAKAYVDVIVPRGGKGLIQYVSENASIPVIETGAGVCHLYIDQSADTMMAIHIADNAKNQRPSVCNAIETILVHRHKAKEVLPLLKQCFDVYPTEIRGDEEVQKIIPCQSACEQDWSEEYNDYIVSIKIVDSMEEAIEHIHRYSTHHSETIVTQSQDQAEYFLNAVDSACVYWNASTRFSDGGEFGFGAELGISTQKLHARGPLGLQEMTSKKYKIYGKGQVR